MDRSPRALDHMTPSRRCRTLAVEVTSKPLRAELRTHRGDATDDATVVHEPPGQVEGVTPPCERPGNSLNHRDHGGHGDLRGQTTFRDSRLLRVLGGLCTTNLQNPRAARGFQPVWAGGLAPPHSAEPELSVVAATRGRCPIGSPASKLTSRKPGLRRETGEELRMKEPYREGVATHSDPESCGRTREDTVEALTGAGAGRVSSREITEFGGADAVLVRGRQHLGMRSRECPADPPRSETPLHALTLHTREPGDLVVSLPEMAGGGRMGKARAARP